MDNKQIASNVTQTYFHAMSFSPCVRLCDRLNAARMKVFEQWKNGRRRICAYVFLCGYVCIEKKKIKEEASTLWHEKF